MTMIKTAISMPEPIFDEVNEVAGELNMSRSGVILTAVREFLRRRENDRMLAQLNAVYAEDPDPEELEFLRWSADHALRLAARLEAEE